MSTEPVLIGLGGYAGAGKDAFAEFLRDDHGVTLMGMSEPLLDALVLLNPWIPGVSFPERDKMRFVDHLDAVGYTEAKKHPEVRRLLQVLGTEIGRDMIGQDTWTNVARKKILAEFAHGRSVALTGIRFPDELAMVHELSGASVWIRRPGVEPALGHVSDRTLSPHDFDIVVDNSGTLDVLREFASSVYAEVRAQAAQWAGDVDTVEVWGDEDPEEPLYGSTVARYLDRTPVAPEGPPSDTALFQQRLKKMTR